MINITASGFSAVSQQSDLSLFLQHNRIIFSVSSPSEGTGKAVHSSRSWELPFAPSPRSIAASYNGTSLFLAVSLPSLSPEKTFLVGQFKVSASSTGLPLLSLSSPFYFHLIFFFLYLSLSHTFSFLRSRSHSCGCTTTERPHFADVYSLKIRHRRDV